MLRCALSSRISRLSVMLWYLLASTNLIFIVLDQVAPATKEVASFDFPCAHHDCGCKSAEQCRIHCCCQMKRQTEDSLCHLPTKRSVKHQEAEQIGRVRISYLSVAQCAGHSQTTVTGVQKLQPHLPITHNVTCARESSSRFPTTDPALFPHLFRNLPDKIPIQTA